MGFLQQALARFTTSRERGLPAINPAGEGNWHAGPYTISTGPNAGFYPYAQLPWNFWQMDIEPVGGLSNAVVDACVWAYVRAIAQLPGYHRRELDNHGIETVTTSALSRLLRFPNSYQTRSDFLTHVVRSLLYTGNSYSLAVRNARNEVTELHWLNPRHVFIYEVAVEGQLTKEVFYSFGDSPILNPKEFLLGGRVVPARDMLHIKLATPRSPLVGESPLTCLWLDLMTRGALAGSLNRFLANASRPSGVIQTDKTFTEAQVNDLRERWERITTGANVGKTPILTDGLKWTQMGISNQDSQLIDALKLTDKTIVGVFGVPGILVGVQDSAPFSSTEALMNWWLANGLGYLLDHIETAIDQFEDLPADEWTEYDTDALLRANTRERIESLARGVQGGIYAPNEARAKEGLPSAKAGDEPRVQQQVVPLSFATKPAAKAPAPASAGKPPAPPAPAAPPPAAAPADAGGSESEGLDSAAGDLMNYAARAMIREAFDHARLAA